MVFNDFKYCSNFSMAKSMSSQNDQSIEKLANPKRFKINDLKLQQFVKS